MSQAMIRKFPRKDRNKVGGFFGPDTDSAALKLKRIAGQQLGHLDLLGLGNHPCEACLSKSNFAYGGFKGINLDGDATTLKPSQAECSN